MGQKLLQYLTFSERNTQFPKKFNNQRFFFYQFSTFFTLITQINLKITKVWNIWRLIAHLLCFYCFSKFWCQFLDFTKGRKSEILKQFFLGKFSFLQNLIFYHWYESINFCTDGLIKIPPIITPLITYKWKYVLKRYSNWIFLKKWLKFFLSSGEAIVIKDLYFRVFDKYSDS